MSDQLTLNLSVSFSQPSFQQQKSDVQAQSFATTKRRRRRFTYCFLLAYIPKVFNYAHLARHTLPRNPFFNSLPQHVQRANEKETTLRLFSYRSRQSGWLDGMLLLALNIQYK
jgi:hypothetical protein